ncbi:MAG: DUF1351 domain-containing protein [Acutalibacteraceae bacterium]
METNQTINNEISSENLIVVTQLPIIQEQLQQVKLFFEAATKEALEIADSEIGIAEIKKRRAELTKVYNALETKRKEVKKSVLSPYDEFEKIYKECVTSIYKPCDFSLASKIKESEDAVKEEKRREVEEYFNEYCSSKMIDFLTFAMADITVTLSASKKSLKEKAKNFVDKVSEEMVLLDMQEHRDEIFVEYKKSLNLAQAILVVTNRHKAIEEEQKRKAAAEQKKVQVEETVKKVEEAEQHFAPPIIEDEKPSNELTEEMQTTEKTYRVTFTVKGTLEKIKALKTFLTEGDYYYEQQS